MLRIHVSRLPLSLTHYIMVVLGLLYSEWNLVIYDVILVHSVRAQNS